MSDFEPDERPDDDYDDRAPGDVTGMEKWLDDHAEDLVVIVTAPPPEIVAMLVEALDYWRDHAMLGASEVDATQLADEWLAQFHDIEPPIVVEPEPLGFVAETCAAMTVTAARVDWDADRALGWVETSAGRVAFSGPTPAAVLNDIDAAFPGLRFAWEPSREGPMVQAMVATITERAVVSA